MRRSTMLQQLIRFALVTTGQMMPRNGFQTGAIIEQRPSVQHKFELFGDRIQACFIYEGDDCNCGRPDDFCGKCNCDFRQNLICSPSTNKCVFDRLSNEAHPQVEQIGQVPIQQKPIKSQLADTFSGSFPGVDGMPLDFLPLDPSLMGLAQVPFQQVPPPNDRLPDNFRGAFPVGANNQPLVCHLDEGEECQCGRKDLCSYCPCRSDLKCLPTLEQYIKRCQVLIPQQIPEVVANAPITPELEPEFPEVVQAPVLQTPNNGLPEDFLGAFPVGADNGPLVCHLDEGEECQCARKDLCEYCPCRKDLKCLPSHGENKKRCQIERETVPEPDMQVEVAQAPIISQHPTNQLPDDFRGSFPVGADNEPLKCHLKQGKQCQCARKALCSYCPCAEGLECKRLFGNHKTCQTSSENN